MLMSNVSTLATTLFSINFSAKRPSPMGPFFPSFTQFSKESECCTYQYSGPRYRKPERNTLPNYRRIHCQRVYNSPRRFRLLVEATCEFWIPSVMVQTLRRDPPLRSNRNSCRCRPPQLFSKLA